jgi:hypothetical protein
VLLWFDEDDGGVTWTHLFFHFLTGPLNTVAGPYRVEDLPSRAPTPSIIAFKSVPDRAPTTPKLSINLFLCLFFSCRVDKKGKKNKKFLLFEIDFLPPLFFIFLGTNIGREDGQLGFRFRFRVRVFGYGYFTSGALSRMEM